MDEIKKGHLKEFNYNEFEILRKISDGSSEVNLAYMKDNDKHVVLKFLKCKRDEYCKKFQIEIENLKKIFENDSVIKFYGITKEPSKQFHSMVLQYYFGKNLREHLKEIKGDWSYKQRMATEIATGMKFIHAANIVHCDLNSKNIMHQDGKLIIIDFSSSMSLENQSEPTLKIAEENVAYVDPKFFNPMLNDNKYDKSSDIYSLGVIFWEISSGRPPFSNKPELKDTKKLKTFLALENRENAINLTPVDYKELYCDSWNPDPKKRPSIEDVISRLNDIEFDCKYQDSNYIPEISLRNSFGKNQPISKDEACLLVTKGSTQDLHIFLSPGKISVGRGNSNDVIIRDQEIAKKHASIIVNYQGKVEINELGTESGIYINGEKLGFRTSRLLIRDDVISMGRSEFQYLPTGEYKSRIDEPLSIYNKAYFLKKLENEFKNSKENKRDLSLLFFDLDHFKNINDQNDHMAGDYVLKELTNFIQNKYVRSKDIFAKYGGDEFIILLKDTNKMIAFEIAEKIRSSVETHSFIYNRMKLSVTLSIGVSEMNSSVKTYNDLLLHADIASKKAKECGRNRVKLWSNEQISIQSRNKLTEDEKNHRELVSSFSSIMDASVPSTMDASFSSIMDASSSSTMDASSSPTMDVSLSPTMDVSLSPTMDAEISVTIIKSNSKNRSTEYYICLSSKETLNVIRNELETCDDFRMGTNCYFMTKNGAQILRKNESKLKLMKIIETRNNDSHFLYIKESAKFDLLQLTYEKGFKFDTDGSIENAKKKAFKININEIEPPSDSICDRKDKTYECNHAPSTNCKRSFIIDGNFSAALEWVCNSLKLSRINSEHTFNGIKTSTIHMYQWRPKKEIIISDIIATDEFIGDVKAALKNNEEDLVKQLRELSERYGHFYAHRLILGGAIVKNKSRAKNTSFFSAFNGDNTNISIPDSVIGGNEDKYLQEGMKSWDESLEDASTWKIIGYDKIYSLFELLDKNLKKEVLNALGHRILKAGTEDILFELKESYIHSLSPQIKEIGNVHNYQVFASIMSKSDKNLFSVHIDYVNKDKNTPVIVVHNIKRENSVSTLLCPIKLGWIIVGPLTNFNFNVQFPLAFRSMKQMASIKKDHCTIKINHYKTCILGICALEADSQSSFLNNIDFAKQENSQLNSASSLGSIESTEVISYPIDYDPKSIEIIVGTHFSTYKESACLFVYNLKDLNKPVDETILQNLALYTCVVDVDVDVDSHEKFNFGQKSVEWKKSEQKNISYAEIRPGILSNNDLMLVSQLFKNCPACKHGFVNFNSNTGQVIYKSINSELLDSVENIAYLLVSSANKAKN
ncbi:GGDEF domain-containing protein [Gigaspora margarita]|uniref:GGDEF domain-containing protein n=1 Tax=Gigaspora margarita TaxID=4874 RepID=A0A8H4AFJ8_GIGMA|nr:GGDEF domain-containing protein [Gigaspora margarita]